VAAALTGSSIEPKAGTYVMAREGPHLTPPARAPNEVIPMDDPNEREPIPQEISIARCRQLLGDDERGMSDEDIEAIRQHAQAMAHALINTYRTMTAHR